MEGGVPYFTLGPWNLGPLPIQPFGVILAFGVVFGTWLGRLRAERLGLDIDELRRSLLWVIGLGFVGAHVFDVLAYQPDKLLDDPLLLFKIHLGISSYGGMLGAAIGFWLFFYKLEPGLPRRAFADTYIWGFVPGFMFGRLGCTIVHDHIGARADDFFLATAYTGAAAQRHQLEPGLYHNLGMYELFYMVVIWLVIIAVDRNGRSKLPPGSLLLLVGALYAPIRFFLDYLRQDQSDPRYAGLTFAQWISIVAVAACLYGLFVLLRGADKPLAEASALSDGESKPGAKPKSGTKAKPSAKAKPGAKPGAKAKPGGAKTGKKKRRKKK